MSGTDPGTKRTTMCLACFRAEQHEVSMAWLVAEARHWFDLYGEQPAGSDWNLPSVRWRQDAYDAGLSDGRHSDATLARLERRHREDGPWPAQCSVLKTFGTWRAFTEAAGFQPVGIGKNRPRVAA